MASNEYHIITEWRVRGTIEEVADILSHAADLARWWPSVYLDVEEIEPGDENGIGKVVRLYTKGWLPYTLRWTFRVTESAYPYGFTFGNSSRKGNGHILSTTGKSMSRTRFSAHSRSC